MTTTRDDPTKVALMGSFVVGGLEAHSFDDLRTILAGKTVGSSFGSDTDAFGGAALFAGLHLDERLTRLTFRLWPPRLPPAERPLRTLTPSLES